MLNIRSLPIEPPLHFPRKPSVAPVENCGKIAEHFPKEGKNPYQPTNKNSTPAPPKPVSFPPTLGGIVNLKA